MFQLERNGFSVPGDVSLIGYDDGFYTGDIGLTTIRQDPGGNGPRGSPHDARSH